MIIEHHTFRLADGVAEGAFLDADRRVQTESAPFCPGFIRRTTARSADGGWLIETLWGSAADAESPERADHPAVRALSECIDAVTSAVHHYETLD